MSDEDLAKAARRRGLERLAPDDVAAAVRVTEEQAAQLLTSSRFPGGGSAARRERKKADDSNAGSRDWTPASARDGAGPAPHRLSIAALGRAFAAGDLTPSTLLAALLDRIEAIDGDLHSFVLVDREGAEAAAGASAGRWASGTPLGPLDGIPVGIKDVIDVAGMPTRCHSRTTSDAPVARDAAIVALLREGGAVIVGKLATHEFAIGGPAFDLPLPPARNPWNVAHHPGGSSSGAGAAVAGGLVPLAIGTDTAGSVRNPASACGIVGLKPGRGVLPVEGVVPLAWTLDHVGLLARSVEDMAVAAAALGIDGKPRAPLRVGYVRHFHERDMIATPDVAAALDRAAALFGACDTELPPLGDFALVNRVILQSEGFAAHAAHFRERPEDLSALTRAALLPGAFTGAETLIAAYRRRDVLTAAVDAVFETVDVLLTASSLEPACRIDDPAEIARTYMLQARSPFNVTGHPALALAAGLSAEGLPLSIQFVGRIGEEGSVLAAAAAWEAACGGPVFPPIG